MSFFEPCRQLLDEVDDVRRRDPARGLRMALRARDLAACVDHKSTGPRWLSLQAQAWAVLGSAYRAVTDLRRAEDALNVALAFLDSEELQPHLDPLARPQLAQRAAYLRCDQRRFGEAVGLAEEAIASYERQGAGYHLGVALVDCAVITHRAGRTTEAVRLLEQALRWLDPEGCPRGFLAATHNLAIFLFESARTREEQEESLLWLEVASRFHHRYPNRFDLLKLRVLHGLTALRLGRFDEGICELTAAQEGFGEIDAFYQQAITLLYLAGVYLELERPDQVKRIAGQLFPIFRHLMADRETTASLMLFYNAAQTESATGELVRKVTAEVERLSRSPSVQPLQLD